MGILLETYVKVKMGFLTWSASKAARHPSTWIFDGQIYYSLEWTGRIKDFCDILKIQQVNLCDSSSKVAI